MEFLACLFHVHQLTLLKKTIQMQNYYINLGIIFSLLIGGGIFSCMKEKKVSITILQEGDKLNVELFNSSDSTIRYHTEEDLSFYFQFKILVKPAGDDYELSPRKKVFYYTNWVTDTLLPGERRTFKLNIVENYEISTEALRTLKTLKIVFLIGKNQSIRSNTISVKF